MSPDLPQRVPDPGTTGLVEGIPVKTSLYISLAGALLTAVSAVFYATFVWQSTQTGHIILDLSGEFSQQALQTEVSCQRYLMSGDRKSLNDYEAALEKCRAAGKLLIKAAESIYFGPVTLAPAVIDTTSRINSWVSSFSGPAIELKRTGDTRKLSTLVRKASSTASSLVLRDAIDNLRAHTGTALKQNAGRSRDRNKYHLKRRETQTVRQDTREPGAREASSTILKLFSCVCLRGTRLSVAVPQRTPSSGTSASPLVPWPSPGRGSWRRSDRRNSAARPLRAARSTLRPPEAAGGRRRDCCARWRFRDFP